jgi:hypothetical protein
MASEMVGLRHPCDVHCHSDRRAGRFRCVHEKTAVLAQVRNRCSSVDSVCVTNLLEGASIYKRSEWCC